MKHMEFITGFLGFISVSGLILAINKAAATVFEMVENTDSIYFEHGLFGGLKPPEAGQLGLLSKLLVCAHYKLY